MGQFKVWVDQNSIIRVKIAGTHDESEAGKIINKLNRILKEKVKNGMILIDMTETGRPTFKARKIHADSMKKTADLFQKAALYGASAMNRVMANFIIKASGRGDKVRYFDTKDNAIEWLIK